MLCDSCRINIAVVHVHEVVSGLSKTVHLCALCAEKINVPPVALENLSITGIIGQKDNAGDTLIKRFAESGPKSCFTCGNTTSALRKTGRLGCPDCYEVFSDFLDEIIPHVHKGAQHYGKNSRVKKDKPPVMEADRAIHSIRSDLAAAIFDENFECAAELRDLLHGLEEKAKNQSPN